MSRRGFSRPAKSRKASRFELALLALHACAVAVLALVHSSVFPLDSEVATLVLVGVMALCGMPHGALDVLLAKRLGFGRSPAALIRFLAFYIAAVGAMLLLWFAAPAAALGLFLLLSAYHFAEDWEGALGPIGGGAMGIVVLSAPAFFHQNAVASIFSWLAGDGGVGVAALLAASMPLLLVPGYFAVVRLMSGERLPAAKMVLLVLSAALLPPLAYFAAMFCIVHAPWHMREVQQRFQLGPLVELVRAGWVWTLLACLVVLAVGAILLATLPSLTAAGTAALFMALSALTVPHTWLVTRLNGRN